MAAVSGVAAITGMVYAFVNQMYDPRDMNQDGKVTGVEDYLYTSRHHKVVFAVPVVSAAESGSMVLTDSPAKTDGIAVAPVFNVVV